LCDHCDALERVLMDLTGPKVADVIMRRVKEKLHGKSEAKDKREGLEPEIVSLESAGVHPCTAAHVVHATLYRYNLRVTPALLRVTSRVGTQAGRI
jgi:hypothetical protein